MAVFPPSATALGTVPGTTPRAALGIAIRHLGAAPVGFHGRVRGIQAPETSSLPAGELERRLIELGFTEGASVDILHQGLFGRDPIAVRVSGATIALRRRDAAAILVDTLG